MATWQHHWLSKYYQPIGFNWDNLPNQVNMILSAIELYINQVYLSNLAIKGHNFVVVFVWEENLDKNNTLNSCVFGSHERYAV